MRSPSSLTLAFSTGLLPAIFAFLISLYLISLPDIGSSSEAREGQVINSILANDTWILPLRNGLVPSKPPLFHWIGAGVSKLFGIKEASEFYLRLPSLLSAFGIVILVYCVTRFRAGQNAASKGQAILAVAILLSCYGFFRMIYDGRVDLVFSFFVTGAIAVIAFQPWTLSKVNRAEVPKNHWTLFWLASALAVLAKGPLGLVLPLSILAALKCYYFGPKLAFKFLLTPRLGWLWFIVIVIPYYLLAMRLSPGWVEGDNAFVGRQIVFENLSRFFGGDGIEPGPWWFYIGTLLRTAAPWSWLFLALIILRWKSANLTLSKRDNFGLIWFLTGLVLFSAATGKRHSYILPLLPGLSIFLAAELTTYFGLISSRTKLRISSLLCLLPHVVIVLAILLILLIGILAVPVFDGSIAFELSCAWLRGHQLGLVVCLLGIAGLAVWSLIDKGSTEKVKLLAASFCLLLLISVVGQGLKNNLKPFKRAAKIIKQSLPITVLKEEKEEFFDPLFYYLAKEVKLANKVSDLSPGLVVLRRERVNADNMEILASFAGIGRRRSEDEFCLVRYSTSSGV